MATMTTGTAYSSHKGINVLMWSHDNLDGNNHYPHKKGMSVRDQVEQRVRETITDIASEKSYGHWAQRITDYSVSVREVARGRYEYHVYI